MGAKDIELAASHLSDAQRAAILCCADDGSFGPKGEFSLNPLGKAVRDHLWDKIKSA